MIIESLAQLNALPVGRIVYDRDLATYRKRADGRWAYPSTAGNDTTAIVPNGMLRYGPLQALEDIGEVQGLTDLETLPPGSVVMGLQVSRKRDDGRWDIAGKHRSWPSLYLLTHEDLPLRVLHRGAE